MSTLVEKQVWTVSQITREIKTLLESRFLSVWVEGEVSNFKTATSGHSYFTLKDEFAQIQAIVFRIEARRIPFQIENGQKLICRGRFNLYEKGGSYSLVIDTVEVKGKGALQLAFEQLKAKLEKEGLFDAQHKKPLPPYPERIGIVTSPTGAALRDILNIIHRRFKGVHVIVSPVRVQGEGAAQEIAQAIDEMNEYGQCDVLIVGRGGGSLEDLWSFNEECVARAIFKSEIPIISAVGHEIDWTIADFVSDLRAPTPSAAAELVVEEREQIESQIRQWQTQMHRAMKNVFENYKDRLSAYRENYVFQKVKERIERHYLDCDELTRQLQNYFLSVTRSKKQEFENVVGRLEALSPLAILARGYSLTFLKDSEVLIKKSNQIKVGDTVKTRLHEGSFQSKVTDIEKVTHGNS